MLSTRERFRKEKFSGHERAFTLAELLVVIAIISLVAAILFPVFAKAKDGAKRVKCISNVKQLTLASLLYSADADDFIIPYWISTDNTGLIVRGWSAVYDLINHEIDYSGGIITPYIDTRDLLYCPSSVPGLQDQYDMEDINRYGMNTYLDIIFGPTDIRPLSQSYIDRPSETIFIADAIVYMPLESSDFMSGDLINAQCAGRARAHGRHFGKANVGWFDGHVSTNTVDIPTRDDSTDATAGTMLAEVMKENVIGDILKFTRTYKTPGADASVDTKTQYYYALQKPSSD